MKKKTVLLVSLALVLLLLLSTNALAENVLEDLFAPIFTDLDMNEFYENYIGVIDYLIFFTIFLGMTLAVLPKKFPGRPGTAMSIAFAFALSFGANWFLHEQMGMTLRDLGPLGMAVIILFLGVVFFKFFTQWGAGAPGVASLMFVVIFSLTRATVPGFYEWLTERSPLLNGLVNIAFLVALVYSIIVFSRLFGTSGPVVDTARAVGRLGGGLRDRFRGRGGGEDEGGGEDDTTTPTTPGTPEPTDQETGIPVSRIKELVKASGMDYRLRRRLMWTDTPLSYLQNLSDRDKSFAYFCFQLGNRGGPFHYSGFSTFLTQVFNLLNKYEDELKRIDSRTYGKLESNVTAAMQEMDARRQGVLTEEFWRPLIQKARSANINEGISLNTLEGESRGRQGYPQGTKVATFRDSIGGKDVLDKHIKQVRLTLELIENVIMDWESFRKKALEIDKKLRKQVRKL